MINIMQQMASIATSHHVSTFFVNGPPGSGKSHLIADFHDELPQFINRSISLGPYVVDEVFDTEICKAIYKEVSEAGFLTSPEPSLNLDDITQFLSDLRKIVNLQIPQYFLLFFDFQNTKRSTINALGDFYSRIRRLEGLWNQGNFRLFIVVSGFWDHTALKAYFAETHTSMPYTVEKNYLELHGISIEQMRSLVHEFNNNDIKDIIGDLLYEVTDGHPASALSILNLVSENKLTVSSLLQASKQAAQTSQAARDLVEIWMNLPKDSKTVLSRLLNQKFVNAPVQLPPYLERLRVLGIAKHIVTDQQSILTFRSWFVELIVQFYSVTLGISDGNDSRDGFDELIPRIPTLCIEGFRVINQIENMVRNFVVARLWSGYCPGDPHPLVKRAIREDEYKGRLTDAYERASEWKDRSEDRGVHSASINPLIAYLSTRDLTSLVRDIAIEINSDNWRNIANSLDNLSGVRDTVMHNQLIDDDDLDRLYKLRDTIIFACTQD